MIHVDTKELFAAVLEKYGAEYLVIKLAEECGELAQACAKLLAVWRHATSMREDEALEHIMEEMADVRNHMCGIEVALLSRYEVDGIADIQARKMERMKKRLIDGDMDEDRW